MKGFPEVRHLGPDTISVSFLGLQCQVTTHWRLINRNLLYYSSGGWSPRSRCQQGWFLPRAAREDLFHASPLPPGGFLAFWCILACRCLTESLPLSSYQLLHVCMSHYLNLPFYSHITHIGLVPTLMTSS